MYFQNHATTIGLIGSAGFITGWGMSQSLAFAMMAGGGALVSGTLLARLFGEAGVTGWLLAGFGAVIATLLGAGLVGAAIGFPNGAAAAIEAVAGMLVHSPLALARWLALMGVAHWVALADAECRIRPS